MSIAIVVIIVWLVGYLIEVSGKTSQIYYNNDYGKFMERGNNLTPKDIWISAIWPLTLIWEIIKGIIQSINFIIGTLLLGFGIKYLGSYWYNEINRRFPL